MNTKIALGKFDRDFQVWAFAVSHGTLLIRSPSSPGAKAKPARQTNLDLLFVGVKYMAVPRFLEGIEIVVPSNAETVVLENLIGKLSRTDKVFILASQGKRYSVVAAGVNAFENDFKMFEPLSTLERKLWDNEP